jgi:hypothetical protein
MPAARRRTVRHRNPSNTGYWQRYNAIVAIPFATVAELHAMSNAELQEANEVYREARMTIAEDEEEDGYNDAEYRSVAYPLHRKLTDYIEGPFRDERERRVREAREVERRAEAEKREARRIKAQATAQAKAARAAAAGIVTSPYFPTKARAKLGTEVYFPDANGAMRVYTVRGGAVASDPGNEKWAAAMIAQGVRDARTHRGDWAVLARGSDTVLASIGKGPKRNPRRRRAPARLRR